MVSCQSPTTSGRAPPTAIRDRQNSASVARVSALPGIGVVGDDAEVVRAGHDERRRPCPAGGSPGQRVPQELRLAQELRRSRRPPTAISSGARRARRAWCTGDSRAASASSSLKSALNEKQHQRREVVHAGERHGRRRTGARRIRSARQSVASSIAARWPPAEWPPTTMRSALAPCARPFAREPRDRAPAFVDDRRDRHVRAQVVVDDRDGDALRDERRRDERVVALVERAPVAAVDEHERAARRAGGRNRSSVSLGPGRSAGRSCGAIRARARPPTARRSARTTADGRAPRRGCCTRARRTPA